ncbi:MULTISPECIES: transposase [unclassified Bartonella]|uniref:transposase n=1 Tax=unclassified Bartonella TaxID=2645622 RepID=UPI002360FE85|nr:MULTISPECIES: transposase [unclassified Bartonella]
MTKHLLLTAHARSVSSLGIVRLSDDKCHAMLCKLRWGSTEIVVCPKCQVQNKAYYITSRKQ